ncbi:MAG TPA: hypothetical protein VHO26_03345 [Propionibacteriaceae bacterium]|nr:hypothetical protein [Propionibacteriaceae bacterium]
MTERLRRDNRPDTRATSGTAGTATLVMGLVFLLVAGLALVYGLGHRLPPDAFRFGLPVLLIALGLLGLTVNRSPRPRRRRRRTGATPRG